MLTGGLGASARDLSTLFVVRAVELYLREGGAFAFVMPHGVLSRKPHTGFRTGEWMTNKSEHLTVEFQESWDLARVKTGFPMVSCVAYGRRSATAAAIPGTTLVWRGTFPRADIPWSEASQNITRKPSEVVALNSTDDLPASPYKALFRNGAILYPRVLMFVSEVAAGPLGSGAGRIAVESMRASQEKQPWKELPALTGRVETDFIHPVYLGETVAPFLNLTPRRAVLPLRHGSSTVLPKGEVDEYPGLGSWWEAAELAWDQNKVDGDEDMLIERIDYHAQLSAQLPLDPLRVVYNKSGNTLAAALVRDSDAVIDHKLYWCPVAGEAEGHYLCAVINSKLLLDRVKPLQALGLFGGRDWDKNIFAAVFPIFDPANDLHSRIADLGQHAEEVAQTVNVSGASTFQVARKTVRIALADDGVAKDIEMAVTELIPPPLS